MEQNPETHISNPQTADQPELPISPEPKRSRWLDVLDIVEGRKIPVDLPEDDPVVEAPIRHRSVRSDALAEERWRDLDRRT